MAFHLILSYSKSPHVSRTLLCILVDLNDSVAWMVSVRPPISISYNHFMRSLGMVQSVLITTDITVTSIFHSYLVIRQSPSARLSFRFHSFSLFGTPGWQSLTECIFCFFFCILLLWSTQIFFTSALEFLESVLADGFSLDFEWQQVSSSLQDTSQYSVRSQ